MNIIDTEELVMCRICGFASKNIAGKHIQVKHKISYDEYKKMFPDAPVQSKNYIKSTTKNSGRYMKTDESKKVCSEMFKGENNPNHSSKTTEKERRSRSPYCIEFTKYKDIEDKEKAVSDFIKSFKKVSPNQKSYWMNKGFSEEESILKISERQKTFTLEKCIEKYGEEKGINIFNDRQNKWYESLIRNGKLKNGYSAISQELFNSILLYYNDAAKLNIYYATKNYEFYLNKKGGGIWKYDFTDFNSMKIIEYNGDIYHANPKKYKSFDRPHPFKKETNAELIWIKDNIKTKVATDNGFQLLTIWDSEYLENKNSVLLSCLDFLNIKNNII